MRTAFLGMSPKLEAKDKNLSIGISAWGEKKTTIKSKKKNNKLEQYISNKYHGKRPHLQIKKKKTNNTIVKLAKYMNRHFIENEIQVLSLSNRMQPPSL